MVYKFPTNMKLWDEYAEIRAEVWWKARFNHDEISALQHAMNLKFQDEAAFQGVRTIRFRKIRRTTRCFRSTKSVRK